MLAGEVWGAIVVCVMIWGSVLWMLERLSHWITGRRYLSFTSSIFYGWGLLLEDHPFEPPPSASSQVSGIHFFFLHLTCYINQNVLNFQSMKHYTSDI